MNVKNNRRKRDSMARITKVFLELVQEKEIGRISVTEICQKAGLNRATFYANYEDIYDLADKVKEDLSEQVNGIYRDEPPWATTAMTTPSSSGTSSRISSFTGPASSWVSQIVRLCSTTRIRRGSSSTTGTSPTMRSSSAPG